MLVHIIQWLACKEAFKMDIKEILKHQASYRSVGMMEEKVVGMIEGA